MLSNRSNSNKPSLVAQRGQPSTAQATGYQLTHQSHNYLPNKMAAANSAANGTGTSSSGMLTSFAQQAKKQRMMYATSVGSGVVKSAESPQRGI